MSDEDEDFYGFRVGDQVWVEAGEVHPSERLRGEIVEIVPDTRWGTPEYHVICRWPDGHTIRDQRGEKSLWTLEGHSLTPVDAVERLAELGDDDA